MDICLILRCLEHSEDVTKITASRSTGFKSLLADKVEMYGVSVKRYKVEKYINLKMIRFHFKSHQSDHDRLTLLAGLFPISDGAVPLADLPKFDASINLIQYASLFYGTFRNRTLSKYTTAF